MLFRSPYGKTLLKNFLFQVCGCSGDWRLANFAEEAIAGIRERVGSDRVICGLSGGVDSAVVAAMLYRAIGDQLSCIMVDNGLLRKSELDSVKTEFSKHFKTDLHVVDGESRFLNALAGVTDPQEKRRRIGRLFIDCFQDEAGKIKGARFLEIGRAHV